MLQQENILDTRREVCAYRQLDKLKGSIPAINMEPPKLMMSSQEFFKNALAAFTKIGFGTVLEMRNYATESAAPTIERVNRMNELSKQALDGVKSGMTYAYDGAIEIAARLSATDGVKNTVNYTFERVGQLKYEDIKTNLETRREQLVKGVKTGAEEIRTYATETLEPTVKRASAVKEYSTSKVKETYDNVKDMGTRVAQSEYNKRLADAVNGVLTGPLGFAEKALDRYLPEETDTEKEEEEEETGPPSEIHPASPEAGSWTRTMVLMTNFRKRLYSVGRKNYKRLGTGVSDLMEDATKQYPGVVEPMRSIYNTSNDYSAAAVQSVTGAWSSGYKRVSVMYGYVSGLLQYMAEEGTSRHFYKQLFSKAKESSSEEPGGESGVMASKSTPPAYDTDRSGAESKAADSRKEEGKPVTSASKVEKTGVKSPSESPPKTPKSPVEAVVSVVSSPVKPKTGVKSPSESPPKTPKSPVEAVVSVVSSPVRPKSEEKPGSKQPVPAEAKQPEITKKMSPDTKPIAVDPKSGPKPLVQQQAQDLKKPAGEPPKEPVGIPFKPVSQFDASQVRLRKPSEMPQNTGESRPDPMPPTSPRHATRPTGPKMSPSKK